MVFSFSVLLGFILDVLLGGRAPFRALYPRRAAELGGGRRGQSLLLCVLLPAAALLVLIWLYDRNRIAWFFVHALLCMLAFETGAVCADADTIARELLNSPAAARRALDRLTPYAQSAASHEIVRETIEVLAGRTIDAAALPILSMLIGGAPLGLLCRGICLLASPVPARRITLARLVRFWPARLGAFFLTIASGMLRYDFNNGRRIYQRDRRNHADPETGQTLSVCAGALHLRFTGKGGLPIGNVNRPVVRTDILRMRDLLVFSAWLMMLAGCFLRILIFS